MAKIACTAPCKAKLNPDAKVCDKCGRSFPSYLIAPQPPSQAALTKANAELAKVGFSREHFARVYHAVFLRELRTVEAALSEHCEIVAVEERVMIVTRAAFGGDVNMQRLRDLSPNGLVEFLRSFIEQPNHTHVQQALAAVGLMIAPELPEQEVRDSLEAVALRILERAGELDPFIGPLAKRLKTLKENEPIPSGALAMARHLDRKVIEALAQRKNDAQRVLDVLHASKKLDEKLWSTWIAVEAVTRSEWIVEQMQTFGSEIRVPDPMMESHPDLRAAKARLLRTRKKEKKKKAGKAPWGIPSCKAFRMKTGKKTQYTHGDSKRYEAHFFLPHIDKAFPPWRLTVAAKDGGYHEQWVTLDRAPKEKTTVDMFGAKIAFEAFDDYPDDAETYWHQTGENVPDDYDEEVYSELLKKKRGKDWTMSKVSRYPKDLNEFFEANEECDCGERIQYVQLCAPEFPIADGIVTARVCVNKKCKAKPWVSFSCT